MKKPSLVKKRVSERKECYSIHNVYTGFRLNLGKRSKMIISGSLLTNFEMGVFFEQ